MSVLVIIGTKAQFIKMAPVLKEMQAEGMPYWLVYTGQHSETFDILERAFGLGSADDVMVPRVEAATKATFARWTLQFWWQVLKRLRSKEWRVARVCLVHGDTMSALFGAIAARLAGVRVAHIEAGLRSDRLFDPFPEEIVRRLVSVLTDLHFVPDHVARANLGAARGRVIETQGNTLRDALATSLSAIGDVPTGGSGGYGVVSIHRNENLSSKADFDLLMQAVLDASRSLPLKFVLHPATRARIRRTPWYDALASAPGVDLLDRMDYPDFVKLLLGSRLLLTDGGSNQEEAAMLGLPTLLLRRTTERLDGLGDGIELSNMDARTIDGFVTHFANRSWPLRAVPDVSPSRIVVDALRDA